MFDRTAAVYDLLYRSIRDAREQARIVAGWIRDEVPGARTVLDVACGTGEHATHLRVGHGFTVTGIDLDPDLLAVARDKDPAIDFHRADMIDFDLGRRFDAVVCLFSSIGYVKTLDALSSTVHALARHLKPGGIALVEPWFQVDDLEDGYVSAHVASDERTTVCRMSWTRMHGREARIEFEYVIGDVAGLRRAREVHELSSFTPRELTSAFRDAGLIASVDDEGLMGRGMIRGRKPAGDPQAIESEDHT